MKSSLKETTSRYLCFIICSPFILAGYIFYIAKSFMEIGTELGDITIKYIWTDKPTRR